MSASEIKPGSWTNRCEVANDPSVFAGNPDILICGNCREMFTELQELLDHKRTYCKLRFTCKCHALNGMKNKGTDHGNEPGAALLCVLCKDSFTNAWDLMVHVQAAHMLNIYELGVPKRRGTGAGSAAPSSGGGGTNGGEGGGTDSRGGDVEDDEEEEGTSEEAKSELDDSRRRNGGQTEMKEVMEN
ncbi:hypothetical protein J437_LFUL007387 [Ladona fulva]|uniref:C2H2-type domain-containing protein n=1 Tax=Ladona fulva TaxID=123851 RepID=A0A8K0NVX7_LADFU|nr:hypothetical protein J437_LFUL007387 [Ladona fulva]